MNKYFMIFPGFCDGKFHLNTKGDNIELDTTKKHIFQLLVVANK